jgi:hypothetical protein
MSLSRFTKQVRIAASPFPPEAWENPAAVLPGLFDLAFEFADIWLTPAALRGYSDADLGGVPAADRDRLRAAVAAFRAVADAVPEGTRPTEDQVRAALPAFATILDVLRPSLADPESLAARRAVWRGVGPYRDWVAAFDLELGEDWTGDPAVRVWFVLRDGVDVTSRAVVHRLYDMREGIRREFRADRVSGELYGSEWGRSEMPEVMAWGPA